ncbi:MAG: pseudouridine-5'-phosphate glycosidase [Candidatus Cloacimonas sp.]|jgi:pseudouridine-5'-phosphate glycosidase|nr:pseudouridine-5'-phosphate glycosidase [Candidatus Cloacimonas sp.]
MTTHFLPIKLASRVQKALVECRAILAMESTVLTHGLPYPRNFEVLATLEELCRENGAEPATIIILDGIAHIGMDKADIANLKRKMNDGEKLHKFGRREIPMAIVKGLSGGTTVSATMLLAHQAGLKVFATGGIGGVHRGWNQTLDISNDLKALAEIPVIVVSAGCKAILDIPATLEYLESSGVPILGWQTDDFPAFYSHSSGFKIDSVDSAKQVAEIYETMLRLDPKPSGMILANPVPTKDEIPHKIISKHIDKAICTATEMGINGKALTPFLLSFLAKSTEGQSVTTNLALLENNVRVGAAIAKELI